MKNKVFYLVLAIIILVINSCANSEDSSGTNKELDQVLDQPNSTDQRNFLDLPEIPSSSCYYIDSSTIDNSTVDNSSITDNALIINSSVTSCAAVSDSNIILSRIDNSSVDNSTVDNISIVINGSYICIESSIDNSTIDNATICNGSKVDGGSTVNDGSSVKDNTTVTNGSSVTNGSTVCNSTLDNSTIDNSTVCTGASMSFVGKIIRDQIVYDTDAPNVISVNSSTSNNDYTSGNIDIYIIFSESVFVDNSTGNPRLLLETGSTDRYANYTSGHGSDNLTFIYTIQSGDKTCDLDYNAGNSLSKNGGTITDNSSNNAVLTLPNPGSNGSLGRNKSIRINPASAKCPSP